MQREARFVSSVALVACACWLSVADPAYHTTPRWVLERPNVTQRYTDAFYQNATVRRLEPQLPSIPLWLAPHNSTGFYPVLGLYPPAPSNSSPAYPVLELPSEEMNKYETDLLVGRSYDPFSISTLWQDKDSKKREKKDYDNHIDDDFYGQTLETGEKTSELRGKRGVVHLYNMISCATECDPISYKGYGCYCGFLGTGRAVDGIDNCCRIHDRCYETLFCPLYTVYFQPYLWKCIRRRPYCALENLSNNVIGACAAKLCECDRALSMCLKQYRCPNSRPFCRSSPLRLFQNILMSR